MLSLFPFATGCLCLYQKWSGSPSIRKSYPINDLNANISIYVIMRIPRHVCSVAYCNLCNLAILTVSWCITPFPYLLYWRSFSIWRIKELNYLDKTIFLYEEFFVIFQFSLYSRELPNHPSKVAIYQCTLVMFQNEQNTFSSTK